MTFLAWARHAHEMTHAGLHGLGSTDSKPTCGHEHNSRLQLMQAQKPSCSGRSNSTLASALCQSTIARLRSWHAVPTLLSAAARRTYLVSRPGWREEFGRGRSRPGDVTHLPFSQQQQRKVVINSSLHRLRAATIPSYICCAAGGALRRAS